jgi:hypothetical protein
MCAQHTSIHVSMPRIHTECVPSIHIECMPSIHISQHTYAMYAQHTYIIYAHHTCTCASVGQNYVYPHTDCMYAATYLIRDMQVYEKLG